jgi:hypothetical protein
MHLVGITRVRVVLQKYWNYNVVVENVLVILIENNILPCHTIEASNVLRNKSLAEGGKLFSKSRHLFWMHLNCCHK